jgi:MFS family permease
MHHPNDHHHHLLNFKINKELKEMYLNLAMRTFSLSLVGVFGAIYLYTIGYSILEILLFLAAYHFAHAFVSVFVSGKLARHFGVKHMMIMSTPFLFGYILLLAFLPSLGGLPLWILAIVAAFGTSLYWVGYHSEFAKFTDKKHRGRQTSYMNIVSSVLAALGPAVGGFFILWFGFTALYVVVFVLLLLSVLPLFMSKDFTGGKRNYRISKLFHKRTWFKDIFPHVSFGISGAVFAGVWPLIIHLNGVFDNITGVGLVFSLSFVVGIGFSWLVGKYSDKMKKPVLLLKLGGFSNVAVWLLRSFVKFSGLLYLAEVVGGIVRPFLVIPFEKHSYERAIRSRNIIEYTVFRETMWHVGAGLIMLLLAIIGNILVAPFIAAIANFGFMFV